MYRLGTIKAIKARSRMQFVYNMYKWKTTLLKTTLAKLVFGATYKTACFIFAQTDFL